jgi:hypothetical protein
VIKKTFFDSPEVVRKLLTTADVLMLHHDVAPVYRLGQIIRMIAANPAEFDENCQINIQWIGPRLMDELAKLNQPDVINTHALATALAYRFMLEYDMSVRHDMSMEVRTFMSEVEAGVASMTDEVKAHVQYARQSMPVAMLKKMLNTSDFGNLRDVSTVASSVDQKITQWEGRLNESETNVKRLGDLLEQQTLAFNFVGLHQGFADLSTTIGEELRFARIGIAFFGVLVLLPGVFDLWLALGVHQDFSAIPTYTLLVAGVGTLTLTLLFLYFFRIALRQADSCRAQLMQVRLRMSLCKFIQSYAEYSKGIRKNNPDALSKFEALIFSGIVGTEDKLPSTFDGIEQLSALAKSIRGTEK